MPEADELARRRARLSPEKLALLEKRLREVSVEKETPVPPLDLAGHAGPSSPVPPAPSFIGGALWESLIRVGTAEARRQALAPALHEEAAREPDMNCRSVAYVCAALEKLGVFVRPEERYSVDELMARGRILPEYRKVLGRWLAMLAEEGLVLREGEHYINPAPLSNAPQSQRLSEPDRRGQAEKLASLLTGSKHPLEFFIPDGSLEAKEKEYVEAPVFRYCNAISAAVMRAVVETLPPGRPMRIIEIGAGTGGTTVSLLPVLPKDRTTYVYTDITRFFLTAAKTRFAMYPFVEYGTLNIEKDPGEQGFDLDSFDLVIAAHVLHATRSIRETVEHVRALLRPRGLLLLLEEIHFRRAFNFTMGFLPGFDRFADYDLRPEHPLLSVQQWHEILCAYGFDTTAAFSEPGSPAELLGVEAMLARAA